MKKRVALINGGLALALSGAVGAAVLAVGDPPTPPASAPTTRVTRGPVVATVSASGNVAAATSVGVDFAVSGTVTAIDVVFGQTVSAGDPLATVDDTKARQAIAVAQAGVKAAEGQLATATQGRTKQQQARDDAQIAQSRVALDNARTSVRQTRATYDQDKATQDDLVAAAQAAVDSAPDATAHASAVAALTQAKNTRATILLRDRQQVENALGLVASARAALTLTEANVAVSAQPPRQGAVKAAEAQLDSAKAQLAQARDNLADTVLRAPIDGTVVAINGVVGESSADAASAAGSSIAAAASSSATSASSAGSTESTHFVVISRTSGLEVTALVAEADAARVAVGQATNVSFPAIGRSLQGSVTSIDLEETVSNNVVEYGVTVALDSPPKDLRLGQTATVAITVDSRPNVLNVPSSAITRVGSIATVTVRRNNEDASVQVQTGLEGDSRTEVISGLSEGDVVVLKVATGGPGGFTFPGGIPGTLGGSPGR